MPAKHSPAGLVAQAVTRSPSGRAVGGRLVGMDPLEIGDRFSGDTAPRLVQGVALADLGQPQFRLCCGEILLRETRANGLRRCVSTCAPREVVLFVPGHVGWLRLHLCVIWGKGSAYGLGEIRRQTRGGMPGAGEFTVRRR